MAHAAAVLQRDPESSAARQLMAQALGATTPSAPADPEADQPAARRGFDWHAAEAALGGLTPPMFVDDDRAPGPPGARRAGRRPARRRRRPRARSRRAWTPRSWPRCATPSCARSTASRCAAACCSTARPAAARRSSPARSPASSAPRSSRSASATCSTCGSASQRAQAPRAVRGRPRARPCVLFLDELDALGQKRSHLATRRRATSSTSCSPSSTAPTATTRASSCSPRPTTRGTSTPRCAGPAGSTARCSCSRPTSRPARRSCARSCASARSRTSTSSSSPRTDGRSGADLVHIVESAAELALQASIERGDTRDHQAELEAAPRETGPSTGLVRDRPQLRAYANDGGSTTTCSPT